MAAGAGLVLAGAHQAAAEPAVPPQTAERRLFALIVGVNQSVDADLPPLVYADDDAVRYQDLFRALGARTYLLTRPDANTRQVFADAVAEAHVPRAAELWRLAATLRDDIAQTRRAGLTSILYVIYAGHGGADDNGYAYITLEDTRIGGEELGRRLVDALGADQTHVVVDACYSYFLAYERGPGGTRRPVHGFSDFQGLATRTHVGLLLSTSSARESHEWEGFHAGVFSHEIRSGLYGAADVDGDGRVSYREIAAFIARANQAIPNDRFRPDVYARPPSDAGEFVDLRPGLKRRLTVDGEARAGHYYLEDEWGNRLADFHNAPGQAFELIRPPRSASTYLHRLADDREFSLRPGPAHLVLSRLESATSRTRPRGAAQHAFNLLFSLPFDRQTVREYAFSSPDATAPVQRPPSAAAPAAPALATLPPLPQPPGHGWGYHMHDRGFLRFFAGPAYLVTGSVTRFHPTCESCGAEADVHSYSGLGASLGVSLGVTVAHNLILSLELLNTRIPNARDSAYDDEVTVDFDQFGFGPGATYYHMPLNLYLSGTLTVVQASLTEKRHVVYYDRYESKSDTTGAGIGINMMTGKEWWVSRNWGIGVATQAHLCIMNDHRGGYDNRLVTGTFALLLSATYN